LKKRIVLRRRRRGRRRGRRRIYVGEGRVGESNTVAAAAVASLCR